MIYIPIIGAIASSGGAIIEKITLRRRKISPRLLQTATFLALVILMIPLAFFFWRIDAGAFELKNILLLFSIILLSVAANAFYFYSMKWEKLTNIEPARLLEPLFVVLIALIFSYIVSPCLFERNYGIIIPALIAAIALLFSHVKKHHLKFNKYFLAAIIASFLFAFELILTRLILDYYNPITLYFVRGIFIFLISFMIFRPKFNKIKTNRIRFEIFLAATFWVIYRISTYYGYLLLGVIKTTLILMIAPIFIYLFAHIFLNDDLNWKNGISSLVILVCVIYVTLTTPGAAAVCG